MNHIHASVTAARDLANHPPCRLGPNLTAPQGGQIMSGQLVQMDLSRRVDIPREIKRALADAIKKSGLSRAQIVDRVNDRLVELGYRPSVSAASLDRWCSITDLTHHIPAHVLGILCTVIGDPAPLYPLALATGQAMIGTKDQMLLRLAHAQEKKRLAAREERDARRSLERLL